MLVPHDEYITRIRGPLLLNVLNSLRKMRSNARLASHFIAFPQQF